LIHAWQMQKDERKIIRRDYPKSQKLARQRLMVCVKCGATKWKDVGLQIVDKATGRVFTDYETYDFVGRP